MSRQSEEQSYLPEGELEPVNMQMPFIGEVNEADFGFVHKTWMATESERLSHDKFQINCERANAIQTKRVNILAVTGESCYPTKSHDPVMRADRDQFVTRHNIPPLLREKSAMAPIAASKPAKAAQRAASTSQAPPPREPVRTKQYTKESQ